MSRIIAFEGTCENNKLLHARLLVDHLNSIEQKSLLIKPEEIYGDLSTKQVELNSFEYQDLKNVRRKHFQENRLSFLDHDNDYLVIVNWSLTAIIEDDSNILYRTFRKPDFTVVVEKSDDLDVALARKNEAYAAWVNKNPRASCVITDLDKSIDLIRVLRSLRVIRIS